MRIRTELLLDINISAFRRMREIIDLNPPYQREGNIWNPAARSLLIDSIINGLDVPKIYFETIRAHKLNPRGLPYRYAVIDGKQRLDSILAFLDNEISLPEDFIYFEDETRDARNLKFDQLCEQFPHLARRFLDFELPIVKVTADNGDLIEEMFQRLNASAALNAAERRNAISGATRDASIELSKHILLTEKCPIKNARYKYQELGSKFLAIEQQMECRNRIIDTKANTLYKLFLATSKRGGRSQTITDDAMRNYRESASRTLDRMIEVFIDANDRLLKSVGTIVVYYIAFRNELFSHRVSHQILEDFEKKRHAVSAAPESEQSSDIPAHAALREYNTLVQSTNDGAALQRRADILTEFVIGYADNDPLKGLANLPDSDSVPPADDEPDRY